MVQGWSKGELMGPKHLLAVVVKAYGEPWQKGACLKHWTKTKPNQVLRAESQIGMSWGRNQWPHYGIILHFQKLVEGPGTQLIKDKSLLSEHGKKR